MKISRNIIIQVSKKSRILGEIIVDSNARSIGKKSVHVGEMIGE